MTETGSNYPNFFLRYLPSGSEVGKCSDSFGNIPTTIFLDIFFIENDEGDYIAKVADFGTASKLSYEVF